METMAAVAKEISVRVAIAAVFFPQNWMIFG